MKLPLNRCFAVILSGLLLAGCQGLPALQKQSLTDAELFARGLDQYSATGDLQSLRRLPQELPDGAWRARAELLVRLAEQQDQCLADQQASTDAKAGAQKQAALQKDKELDRCRKEMADLRQNNQDLEETIAQLKKLLIDMESRSN